MKDKIVNSPCAFAHIIRRLILSWLCAASLSFLALPPDKRSPASVDGLAAMSLLHTILLTAAVFALLFFVFVGGWTVFRVLTFASPTFDFGIFSHMFSRMRATGLPDTTLERDGLLSHFKVHMSPIYYLMLPFYCLAPSPVTLQLLQAAVMASAAIPLWKLATKYGCTPFASAALYHAK